MSLEQSFTPEPSLPPEEFRISGRILYLTSDPEGIKRQLEGEDFSNIPEEELLKGISTDEIISNRICLQYTGHEKDLLGSNLLVGLRGNAITPGAIQNGGFKAIVAGESFGRGSSRYHAPIALVEAGIQLIIAEPERIFGENAVNAGINVLTPKGEAAKQLLEHKSIDLTLLKQHLTPVSKDIMTAGSLVGYLRLLQSGEFSYPLPDQTPRPMTMIEKMIARKTHTSGTDVGVGYVKPGEEVIAKPDAYYGYELQTTVVRRTLNDEFGTEISIPHPEKAYLFNDHTALIQHTEAAQTQQREQKVFADEHGIINFENGPNGSVAICHTKMLEDVALPGQLILGNDSHTCTLGAVNTLAIGKGAADLAGALAYDQMVIKVPETIKIELTGQFAKGVTMKDFMLHFGATKKLKEGIGSGRVFQFGGDSLDTIPFDEQIKLTNMAIELQAFTGIIEPNTQMLKYLQKRGLSIKEITNQMVTSDDNAIYYDRLPFDLSRIEPTIATPGDTQNGVPLSEITKQNIKIQKAYIGSCTHGTPEDLKQAAEVIKGRKLAPGVELYIQASSENNLEQATNAGDIQDLINAGAQLLPIGCGACMNAGPGSTEEGEIGIYATNRNYPGRTGKGPAYLASPAVVVASAIKGFICGPEDLETL